MVFDIYKLVGTLPKDSGEDAIDTFDWNTLVDSEFKVTIVSTTPYTALDTDGWIFVSASGGARTVNLPAANNGASKPRKHYIIVKTDSSGNAVTIDGNASETINGSTTKTLAAQYDWIWIKSDGTNWIGLLAGTGGGGGGEANTASSAGLSGVGLTLTKSGTDLPFKNIDAGSSKITVTNDATNKTVDIDVAQANLDLSLIGGLLPVSKGGTNLTTYTAGELLYAPTSSTIDGLTVNATTTRKFARQVGNGSAVTSTAWDVLAVGDVPNDISTQKVEVVKNSGAIVSTRKQLNFIEGSNITLTVADDVTNNQTDITITGSAGGGSSDWVVVSKSINYTAAWGEAVLVTTGSSTITITLPTAAGNSGKRILVKKVDSGTGSVVIDGNAAETIDGATTVTLYVQWQRSSVFSDGTNIQEVV